ncbi:MAG: T9SS type A sorting domain-containing protein [Bacteroidetes bacterium]|nr:T9SS type A sorting domain-containing protein [Bacteroidota bacterium]
MKKSLQIFLFLTTVIFISVEKTNGATKTWTGGGDGITFNSSSNWDTGVPGANDAAVISVNYVGFIYVTANTSIKSLKITFASSVIGVFQFAINPNLSFTVADYITIINNSNGSFGSTLQMLIDANATVSCNDFSSTCNAAVAIAQNNIVNKGNFTVNGNIGLNTTATRGLLLGATTTTYVVNSSNFTVKGTTTTSTAGTSDNSCSRKVFIGTEDDAITTFEGNVTFNGLSKYDSVGIAGKGLLGVRANSTGKVIFRGDLTLGNYVWNVRVGSSSNYTLPNVFIFDRATGLQTITNNAGSQIYFPSLQVGISNSPEVILSAASLKKIRIYSGDITINNTSILDLTTDSLNRYTNGGSLMLNSSASLKLGGDKGGQDGSNFPKNFSVISLNATSTVEYNGASLNQTIYPTGNGPNFSYGNLKLSNGGIKTVGSGCPAINGTVYITGATTKVDDGGHTFGQDGTNLTQDGGRFILRGTGTKPDMKGIFTITGGVVEFANTNSTPQTIRNKSYQDLEVTGSNVGNSSGNITLNSNGSFTVKSGGLFYINDNSITCPSGNGKVVIENNAVFKTGNDQGFCGFTATFSNNSAIHSNITNISLATGSTIVYTRSTDQVFSARTDYSNVTISGGSNKAMNGDVTINGILTNGAGNQLVLNDFTLTENTSITGDGTLTGSRKSGLIFGSNATATNLKFTANNFSVSPPDSVKNYLDTLILLSNAQVTLGDSLNITASDGTKQIPVSDYFGKTRGLLRVDAGATLFSKSKLTLRSDDYGDAYLAESYGSIPDTVRFERYFYAKRAWRLISVPFSSSNQSINAAWQEGNIDATPNSCPVNIGTPGYGTAITYDNNASIGYDWHNNNYKTSIEVYQDNAWAPLPSGQGTLYTNICDYPAYCLFVRGDRTICMTNINSPNKTTLRSKGILHENGLIAQNAATETFNTTAAADQFVLIGNPFPAPVKFTRAGIYSGLNTNTFYFFDPGLTGNYGVGAYITYSVALNNWLATGSGVYTGTEQPFVQSGQAFMMMTDGASTNPSATFLQSDKGDNQFNVSGPNSFVQKDTINKRSALYIYLQSVSDSMAVVDAVAIAVGKQFAKTRDVYDAPKLWNEGENMAIKNDTNYFMVDARPAPKLTDTAFVKLYLYNTRQYALKIFGVKSPYDIHDNLWLVDNYLGTKTKINQEDTLLYNFTPNSDTNSYRGRFMIVCNKLLQTIPVPVSKIIDTTQKGEISTTARLDKKELIVFPNPVQDILHVQNIDKDAVLKIYDVNGKLVLTQKPEKSEVEIHFKHIASGIYILTSETPFGKLEQIKFVKDKYQ